MEEILKVKRTDGIVHLILSRPKSFNALDRDMTRVLSETLINLASDPEVVGVVFSGEGKAFCAGGDLRWIKGQGGNHGAALHELTAGFHQAISEIRRMPKPVVAAINGMAAGGGFSLALACDFRIMEESATLVQAYTSRGLSIDGGGTFTLPRLVGLARSMEIIAFDMPIDSEKAYSWGLVTEIVENGEGVNRAFQMLQEMQKVSLNSFASSKKLLTESFETSLETQLEKERELMSWCSDQPDGREGIAAFLEKRAPVFKRS